MAGDRKWADSPLELIETPSKNMDVKKHAAVYIANEMAFAHDAMIRGINSIYNQAAGVSKDQDITDLLYLTKTWAAWVRHHHDLEEEMMFPRFEKLIGKPGFLEDTAEQHHRFSGGLEKLQKYAEQTQPLQYRAKDLKDIVDEFSPAFHHHLKAEITALLSLRSFDGAGMLKIYEDCESEAGKQPKDEIPPMVMGLCDKTYEGGNSWPAMPFFAPYIIHYVFARKHAGAWRFLPCDTFRQPRPLPFAAAIHK